MYNTCISTKSRWDLIRLPHLGIGSFSGDVKLLEPTFFLLLKWHRETDSSSQCNSVATLNGIITADRGYFLLPQIAHWHRYSHAVLIHGLRGGRGCERTYEAREKEERKKKKSCFCVVISCLGWVSVLKSQMIGNYFVQWTSNFSSMVAHESRGLNTY